MVDFSSVAELNRIVDAIVVPGGGSQRSEDPLSLPPWVCRRLDRAIQLYREQEHLRDKLREKGDDVPPLPFIITLSAGTPHRPNFITSNGWPVLEAASEARYIQIVSGLGGAQRIPDCQILRESTSLDTIGNAYFLRVQHLDPGDMHRIVVVTSEFHMPRSRAIFNFVLDVKNNHGASPSYSIFYETVSDEGLDVASRQEKEQKSLISFNAMVEAHFSQPLFCIKHLHRWLFTEHKAYCTHDKMIPDCKTDTLPKEVLDTY